LIYKARNDASHLGRFLDCGACWRDFRSEEDFWVVKLYPCRYPSRDPVLNALDTSVFFEAKNCCNLRRPSQLFNQFAITHFGVQRP